MEQEIPVGPLEQLDIQRLVRASVQTGDSVREHGYLDLEHHLRPGKRMGGESCPNTKLRRNMKNIKKCLLRSKIQRIKA